MNSVKNGFNLGHQRFRCTDCGCVYTDTKPRGISPLLRNLGVILYAHHGVSMTGIAKLFKVSTIAVLKWIRKASDKLVSASPSSKATLIQVDEMWHFVNGKKQNLDLESCGWDITSSYRLARGESF